MSNKEGKHKLGPDLYNSNNLSYDREDSNYTNFKNFKSEDINIKNLNYPQI